MRNEILKIMSRYCYFNKKNGKPYAILYRHVINKTNANDGQRMVVYQDIETLEVYTREESEFLEKFSETPITGNP